MHQKIIGYHRDDEKDWVAELACTHQQHVRHKPPFFNRPWVTTEAGRQAKLGSFLDCVHCERIKTFRTSTAKVMAVCSHPQHAFSKTTQTSIELIAGWGVKGDAHAGPKIQHRSRVAQNPDQPNLRQIHLIQVELLQELADKGHAINPGQLGENITTRGLDLLALPRDSKLFLGSSAVVQVTGLRNPCAQINQFQTGLLDHVVEKDTSGQVIRKAGIMGIVLAGGSVKPEDPIFIEYPEKPFIALERI